MPFVATGSCQLEPVVTAAMPIEAMAEAPILASAVTIEGTVSLPPIEDTARKIIAATTAVLPKVIRDFVASGLSKLN